MRLRNIPGADEVIQNSTYVVQEPQAKIGKWNEVFGNEHPIYIEVGMGKGRFITDMARLYPEINFVGIERYTSVLLSRSAETGNPGANSQSLLSVYRCGRIAANIYKRRSEKDFFKLF